jgi:glutamate-1-semialdehyde 2,1-aminomutase
VRSRLLPSERVELESSLEQLIRRELASFRDARPRSAALHERASHALVAGVPMNWMNKWASAFPIEGEPGAFPIYAERAEGAELFDVDGLRYADFCLGDTGAMTGHSPAPIVEMLAEHAAGGFTSMLPGEASVAAGEALAERFGLPAWQLTVSATDANRFAIRLARALTGRRKVLVFNRCYHGSVDESFATLDSSGAVLERANNMGAPVPPSQTTRVVEFNDVRALERELEHHDVACVLCEPALTNVGIVLPDPHFHTALRLLTRTHGTLLVMDETHTISAGPGGYTSEHGLEPDILTVGKAIAGGLPAGAYGISGELRERIDADSRIRTLLTEGIGTGGTLAGNALTARAIAVTLSHVLTPAAFDRMSALCDMWREGVQQVIERFALPWHVTQLGARAEYQFTEHPAHNGTELALASDEPLERFLRLYLINRGVITTPFHNMALMSPVTAEQDIELHTALLDQAIGELG